MDKIEELEQRVKALEHLLHLMIYDLDALKCDDATRTGFSDELYNEIDTWKELLHG